MWKEWLSFSKTQQRGILVLIILVIAAALFPAVHQTFFYKPFVSLDSESFQRVDSFFTSLSYTAKATKEHFSFTDEEKNLRSEPESFPFDPNTINSTQLVRLGLSKSQATTIVKYRNKGGIFMTANDFSKMYVIDSAMFNRLKPYIQIELTEKNDTTHPTKPAVFSANYESEPPLYIELNTVDTLEITKIKGIGRGYARRIISYRNLLGGFHSVDQLAEVYGFPPDLLESIRSTVWVDTLLVNKLNINLVEYQTLKAHPYLTNHHAKAIIYYRETMGNFNSLDEMVKHKLIDKETLQKIRPYLEII
ncbi:MAG: helix-hairpin-helix domain-containing protein [Bacteroidales bacterium]|nr:helix-hairpin-helix domain-containing protein [Tenuifilaceae bacterium]